MSEIHTSIEAQEAWLRARLNGALVEADLAEKRRRMRKSAFAFLRATCWRWAQTAAQLCPEAAGAPLVLAVGDAHVENFGVWRDREARLVWGLNDFDEAARTAYAFDLIRLTASAILAADEGKGPEPAAAAQAILTGYVAGIETPRPFILENDHAWLDALARPTDKVRRAFWDRLMAIEAAPVPPRYQALLRAALPDEGALVMAPRRAGLGSLGRPRFIARGVDPLRPAVREVRALIPSCWEPNGEAQGAGRRLLALARGPHRSPDPWTEAHDGMLVGRLAPDGRKLEFADLGRRIGRRLLTAMGWEIGSIHAADPSRRRIVLADLHRRQVGWLEAAGRAVAMAALRDWKEFRR